jgi:glycosyltransferase involved in cell wall biosynthesis
MIQVEANACEKPVLGINAMGLLDTMIHGETALLAGIAQEIRINETIVGEESGFESGHRIVFKKPRTVDYRASVFDIAEHLLSLMIDAALRKKLGEAGRQRVIERFNYRTVAGRFVEIISKKLGID